MPAVSGIDDPRLAGFYDRVLVGQPYVMNKGLASEVPTVVIGKSRSMNYDGRILVEATDGRRWEVGSDRIKRQLIESGVNINIVYLWEALSMAERSVLRGLAFEPVAEIDEDFMRRYGVKLAEDEGPAQVIRMLRARYRLVGMDGHKRLVLSNDFVLRWVRRMGRPNPEAALPDAFSEDSVALAVVEPLGLTERRVLRALAFEPTDSFGQGYCEAHHLDPASTLERFHQLRRDRRLIELDHNDQYVLRGRALRRAVLAEWAAERRAAGLEVATEDDAGALVTSLSRHGMYGLRAIAWRAGDPRDADYRREAHLPFGGQEASRVIQELLDRSVILSRLGRFEVADDLLAAWTRGVMRTPVATQDISIVARAGGAGVLDALQRKIVARGMAPLVRGLINDPPRRLDPEYISKHAMEAGPAYRGFCWLTLELGLLDRDKGGRLAFRDAAVAAVLGDRFKAEAVTLPLGAAALTATGPWAKPQAPAAGPAKREPLAAPKVALQADLLPLDL